MNMIRHHHKSMEMVAMKLTLPVTQSAYCQPGDFRMQKPWRAAAARIQEPVDWRKSGASGGAGLNNL